MYNKQLLDAPEKRLQGELNRKHFNESTDPETKNGFLFYIQQQSINTLLYISFVSDGRTLFFVASELELDHNAPHLRCVTTDSFKLPKHEVRPGFVTFRPAQKAFMMSVYSCLMSPLHKSDLGRRRGKELQNIINHGNKLMNVIQIL